MYYYNDEMNSHFDLYVDIQITAIHIAETFFHGLLYHLLVMLSGNQNRMIGNLIHVTSYTVIM